MLDCPICASGDVEHRHLLTVMEAASEKDCHPHTIRKAVREGRVKACQFGRMFFIEASSLSEWQPRQPGRPARELLATGSEATPTDSGASS